MGRIGTRFDTVAGHRDRVSWSVRAPKPAAPDGLIPRLVRLPSYTDGRGRLTVADSGAQLPFTVVRYFVIDAVGAAQTRANHAQRTGHEMLSCVAGECTVVLRWRDRTASYRLDDPTSALYVPPLTWVECREFDDGAVLLVLCSRSYDPLDQITDLGTLLAEGQAPA